ncbi:MAG: phosphoheptose isomerase [Balneolales bacterium]|nr:phosphoheptose isomerase [Balneolales bacterium]
MPDLFFESSAKKAEVFDAVQALLNNLGLISTNIDSSRPWGGFFVIDEEQSSRFIETFFPHLSPDDFKEFAHLSPKILIVEPGKRLSWQYHHRRAEIWKVIGGDAGVIVSDTDAQGPVKILDLNQIVELKQGERHRLVGQKHWGILAEIWKHTDASNPSDEQDIVRVEDDFGR